MDDLGVTLQGMLGGGKEGCHEMIHNALRWDKMVIPKMRRRCQYDDHGEQRDAKMSQIDDRREMVIDDDVSWRRMWWWCLMEKDARWKIEKDVSWRRMSHGEGCLMEKDARWKIEKDVSWRWGIDAPMREDAMEEMMPDRARKGKKKDTDGGERDDPRWDMEWYAR